jgi:transketolase
VADRLHVAGLRNRRPQEIGAEKELSVDARTQNLRRNSVDVAAARRRCLGYRRRILDISQQVGALHIAPAFSCTEITDVLYNGLMRRQADGDYRDVFLMSKGHGCMIQYVILEEQGALTHADLDAYCKPNGRLGAHPDYETPGIAASTGSLGHGLGMATGQAYAEKLKETDVLIYCVLSDGEFQEGSTWEAMMMAANLKLDNLIAFMDFNDFGGLERMSDGHPAFYPLVPKAEAFGWEAVEIDGHDEAAMYEAVLSRRGGRPMLLVCRTVKGKGISFMENVPIWHYRSPNKEEYQLGLRELADAPL